MTRTFEIYSQRRTGPISKRNTGKLRKRSALNTAILAVSKFTRTMSIGSGEPGTACQRFAKEKDGTDFKFWMYGPPPTPGVPSDLGYWIGRRICESYYERATDKSKALVDIIEMRNPPQLYARSAYAR